LLLFGQTIQYKHLTLLQQFSPCSKTWREYTIFIVMDKIGKRNILIVIFKIGELGSTTLDDVMLCCLW
jgi:hypothetical protein